MIAPREKNDREDLEVIASVVSEAIDRRRRGEDPTADEYVRRYPRLRAEIEAEFETIALLEGKGAAVAGEACPLGELISSLPPLTQRMIFLRDFEKRHWDEIARLLGQPELELRQSYTKAIRGLIERGSPQAGARGLPG